MSAGPTHISDPRAGWGDLAAGHLPGRWVGAVPNPWVAHAPERVQDVPVSPFMERLHTPMPGRMMRWQHVLEMAVEIAFGHLITRTLLIAIAGHWIGHFVDAAAGPYEMLAKGQGALSVNWSTLLMTAAIILGLSARFFFLLAVLGSGEGLVLVVILATGLATAFTALSGRLAAAFATLAF